MTLYLARSVQHTQCSCLERKGLWVLKNHKKIQRIKVAEQKWSLVFDGKILTSVRKRSRPYITLQNNSCICDSLGRMKKASAGTVNEMQDCCTMEQQLQKRGWTEWDLEVGSTVIKNFCESWFESLFICHVLLLINDIILRAVKGKKRVAQRFCVEARLVAHSRRKSVLEEQWLITLVRHVVSIHVTDASQQTPAEPQLQI